MSFIVGIVVCRHHVHRKGGGDLVEVKAQTADEYYKIVVWLCDSAIGRGRMRYVDG